MTKMVFWHGWAMSPAVWTPLIQKLSSQCQGEFDFQAEPLPGYGDGIAENAMPVSGWVDSMMSKVTSPIILCGWSMGAMMALDASNRYPEKIQKLVLFGATPCFINRENWQLGQIPEVAEQFKEGVQKKGKAVVKRFITLFNQNDVHSKDVVRNLASLDSPSDDVLLKGLDFLHQADYRNDIETIKQPVLLIHGRNDPLMPVSAAEWLAEKMPNTFLKVIDDAAHAPLLSYTDECAGLIREFLCQ